MNDERGLAGRSRKRSPWYGEGLRFTCVPACGACCTKHGDCDYVYLDGDDVERLAAHFGWTSQEFLARHGAEDDGLTILRMDGPACPFLEGARCAVYAGRPRQCRTFPFWKENLRTRSAWESLREFCPGIGEGEAHTIEAIRARLASSASDPD